MRDELTPVKSAKREHWGTRIGLILAMAGNAIGFGNFLRFPGEAAANGGGAFMIPYFAALILLGIPLMWVEWALGRFGGVRGHGTSPGIFELIWRSRLAKYVGLLGVALPFLVVTFYIYVEAWTLAYTWFSATGKLQSLSNPTAFDDFFNGLTGGSGYWPIYAFFVITVLVNYLIMRKGISGGIEKFARIALPTLFVLAVVLVIRVLLLGSPVPEHPERSVASGFAFLWNPDFSHLSQMKIWLAATGQVFFTLSLGFGVISCYASYLRKKDDIVLSGLTTSVTNEFAEVILGASLAIPLAFAFLDAGTVKEIAGQTFKLAFVTLPMIFQQIFAGQLLAMLWFMLLFFAGVTSSIALSQAVISFMEDEYGWSREKAAAVAWGAIFACANLVIFGKGVIDELSFWASVLGIAVFALIEVVLFVWVFGPKKAWAEINMGADIRLPKMIYYVLTYITPVYLIGLLVAWVLQDGVKTALMHGIPAQEVPWRWAARALMLGVVVVLAYLIRRSRHLKKDEIKEVVTDA